MKAGLGTLTDHAGAKADDADGVTANLGIVLANAGEQTADADEQKAYHSRVKYNADGLIAGTF